MNNIHGRRINNDILRRAGSGYTASHGRDFMLAQDPWYMGVTLQYGPDGAVYAGDWSDTVARALSRASHSPESALSTARSDSPLTSAASVALRTCS